ncbi:MAG: hypothetical protein FWF72_01595 [Paludibacter sp.]|nr:hypothetical protein [Paludibacter sp.]
MLSLYYLIVFNFDHCAVPRLHTMSQRLGAVAAYTELPAGYCRHFAKPLVRGSAFYSSFTIVTEAKVLFNPF